MAQATVYVTSFGVFLPGKPVDNESIDHHLGTRPKLALRIRDRVLAANGIKTRYYALSEERCVTHSCTEMAIAAAKNALRRRGFHPNAIDLLAVATSFGDAIFPALGNLVHGQLGGHGADVLTTAGVCAAGMSAFQASWLSLRSGHRERALVIAAERPSAMLNSERFSNLPKVRKQPESNAYFFNGEFLRWMLSDGAGAMVLERRPHPLRPSLRVEFVELRSYANELATCMYFGLADPTDDTHLRGWLDYSTATHAEESGLLVMRQNTKLLEENICEIGAREFRRLIDLNKIDVDSIDHFLPHVSSFFFWDKTYETFERHGIHIPKNKWFTNLRDVGNIGSASIFVMLEEAMTSGLIKPGEKVLLLVPESARFTMSFALLTCVAPRSPTQLQSQSEAPELDAMIAASPVGTALFEFDQPVTQFLARELASIWADYETRLAKVPIIERIEMGMATIEDYRNLLVNIRQQVVHGGQWISRLASNFSMQHFALRSAMIKHAADEHRDYQLLEENFVAIGGDREEILTREKNLGSEALSAFIFQQASLPDPLDLLGAIFIIEGTGFRKAGHWARCLKDSLDLRDDQVSFLAYHGDADDDHMAELRKLLAAPFVTEEIAHRIVRTAKVTARLYLLQLEEINNV